MGFAERAVNACVKAMSDGKADEQLTQDILKCSKVDVTPIEQFLKSSSRLARGMAVRIIGKKGNTSVLIDAALTEQDTLVLIEMMNLLIERKADGVDRLEHFLRSEDVFIRESAINMFRKLKIDHLFPMLFDEDDRTVKRIKRYFDEQERQNR